MESLESLQQSERFARPPPPVDKAPAAVVGATEYDECLACR